MQLNTEKITACILDMDGVVTQTAQLHAEAWKRMFDEFLARRGEAEGQRVEPFDSGRDYPESVDGIPRYDGVRRFLASRGITLPEGDPADPPERETVCGLGNRKNGYFLELLAERGATPYPATVAFIREGLAAGIRFALISASRNAKQVVASAGVEGLFAVTVDGEEAAARHLPGKPSPAIFLEAAARLGVAPGQAVVIEDALAGVEAGRSGGFALVVGIDRNQRAEALRLAGAHLVVKELCELAFNDNHRGCPLPSALEAASAIRERLRSGRPALFLDYDGTLTAIVADQAEGHLSQGMRRTLERLSSHLFVAIISGRGLDDLRERVGIEGVVYVGCHGLEGSAGSGYFKAGGPSPEPYRAALDRATAELAPLARNLPGVSLEQKPLAVAVHYRGAQEQAAHPLEKTVDAIVSRHPELKKVAGKKVFELRPAVEWDKGRALIAMLEHFHADCSEVIPLYIGDGATDEDAFRAIAENGIAILVSACPRPTAAHFLLRDPSEVREFLEQLHVWTDDEHGREPWTLTYEGFDPATEKLRESLCALGNGYLASRGAAPESRAGDHHYPGSYMAGCYNRLTSEVTAEVIENESLVNLPNWLPLRFRFAEGPWFETDGAEFLEYCQELDMAAGLLARRLRYQDPRQGEVRVCERRLVSMESPHLAGVEIEITAAERDATVTLRTMLDGAVANTLVERYRDLSSNHLRVVERGLDADGMTLWLQAETLHSRLRIAVAGRTRFFIDGTEVTPPRQLLDDDDGWIGQEAVVTLPAGARLKIVKIVALYNSRDWAISESLDAARRAVAAAPGFECLRAGHARAWRHLWQRCGIDLRTKNHQISRVTNLYLFHLLQTVSAHSIDLDVGIPPRGLHGEAYRGLIMWDELFVFPFLNLRIPDLTRALLLYRYRRLPEAKRAARQAGRRGALFPWQSGSNGREEAQSLHLNPSSGHWLPDHTRLQRHINIAVAYNVWLYYQVSGDLDFLAFYGAEMIIEIARFWASLATYNEGLKRYEIKGVMGPDEFHSRYPGAEEPGIDNNAYTNIMVVWVLCRALELLDLLPPQRRAPLWENLGLEQRELGHWEDISRRMRIVFHADGIISQFEGYEGLAEFDWEGYRARYGNIHRLDRILEAEGDTPDRYQLSKQADVLMLFYLLSADELSALFTRLGYPFVHETIPQNIDYYLGRTSHGSTLSRVVHAWVLARSQREQSWHLFRDALKSDVADIQGGTTQEGIHLGAMAGTVDLLQRCYTGLETRDDTLWFNPTLPKEVEVVAFNMLYRLHWLRVTIRRRSMTVVSRDAIGSPIMVGLRERVRELQPGQTIELDLGR